MRQYNEKPSQFSNLGEDIKDAARHRRDTYETPEELRTKAMKKQSTKDLKALKAEYKSKFEKALGESTEAAQAVLKSYEFKAMILGCNLFQGFQSEDIYALKSLVLAETDRTKREVMRKAFNRGSRLIQKIRYIRPIELPNYFEPKTKNQFREVNGHEVKWDSKNETFDVDFLKNNVKSVQYGNSLTDKERVYVSEKLIESIQILQKYFKLDFLKGLGFSYGARGKSGSIAHYQDSNKVLAFNRGWDGALVHELGHAIDYHFGLVSKKMPYDIKSRYSDKIRTNGFLWSKREYYLNSKEIFARLFEAWVYANISERTEYMIFLNESTCIPDFGPEEKDFMDNILTPILKGI